MKKLLILLIPILLWSCEKTNKDIEVISNPISDNTMTVSNETIRSIALKNINELNSNNSTTSTKSNEQNIQIETSFVIKDNKGRNAINIFTYKDKKGWNIISGDNRFNPILAYNGSGEARLDTSLNPGLKYWIEDILKQIEFMDNNEIKQSKEMKFQWGKYSKNSTLKKEPIPDGPPTCMPTHDYWAHWNSSNSQWEGLTQLEWNQTAGFNHYYDNDNCDPTSLYCDKYPAGCGPVAMGMVMHYYQKPNNFIFEGYYRTINYGLMDNYIDPYGVNCANPEDSEEEVAALLRYVSGKYGHKLCTSIPLISGTSFVYVYPNDIMQTFSDWGYSNSGDKINYYDDPNHTCLLNNLKLLKPVIFYGKTCDLCYGSAHYWLAEGLHQYTDIDCATHRWLYMNWGLGIGDNGWFTLTNQYSTIINGEIVTYDNAHMKIYVDINP